MKSLKYIGGIAISVWMMAQSDALAVVPFQQLPMVIGMNKIMAFINTMPTIVQQPLFIGLAVILTVMALYLTRKPGVLFLVPLGLIIGRLFIGVADILWPLPFLQSIVLYVGLLLGIPSLLCWRAGYFPILDEEPDTTHGSAAWATLDDVKRFGRLMRNDQEPSDSFALGRIGKAPRKYNNRLRYKGHVLTCAPTGAGKGIGAVIPNLLEYRGSAIVLDIKGENYAITQRQRRFNLQNDICLLDPFGVTGEVGHAFNWLDCLDLNDKNVVSNASMLASMIVVSEASENAYWNDAAQDLLRGLLLYVASLPESQRHMGELRRLLTSGELVLNDALKAMEISDIGFGVVARTAFSFQGKAEKEKSGVLSSAIRHTDFLDDPRIIDSLQTSDFKLGDIKQRLMTVYLVMPPAKLSAYKRYMRCVIGLALAGVTEQPNGFPVAFFLDEFAQLGYMKQIEDAISLMRGYGLNLWILVQDLSQLKSVYPKWQTFLANCTKQFFGTADYDTAQYISNSLGEQTIQFKTQGFTEVQGKDRGRNSQNQQFKSRKLLTPDEVMGLGKTLSIVMVAGERPYCLQRLNYRKDTEYSGLFDQNPMHSIPSNGLF